MHGDLTAGATAETVVAEVMVDPAAVRERVAAPAPAAARRSSRRSSAGGSSRSRSATTTTTSWRALQQEALRTWPGDMGTSARARTVAIDETLAAGVQRLLVELDWFGLRGCSFVAPVDGAPGSSTSTAASTARCAGGRQASTCRAVGPARHRARGANA